MIRELRLLASPAGGNGNGAVKLHQDAEIFVADLAEGESVQRPFAGW